MDVRNHFLVDGPAILANSGGRTSGEMVRRIVEAHGGKLPDDVKVVFSNTSKEDPRTLDFLNEQDKRWNLNMVWLEWVPHVVPTQRFRVVTYETAKRDGEVFEAFIKWLGQCPHVTDRACTSHMKIKVRQYWAKSIGWGNDWTCYLGLRADEPERVAKSMASKDPWDKEWPLYRAGISVYDVVQSWKQQPFDLQLPVDSRGVSAGGNCNLCFLKNEKKIISLIRKDPQSADWWARMELEQASLFRMDRPNYSALKVIATQPQLFEDRMEALKDAPEDNQMACECQ